MQELEEGTRQALQGEEHKNEALQGVVASFPVVFHPESSPNPQGLVVTLCLVPNLRYRSSRNKRKTTGSEAKPHGGDPGHDQFGLASQNRTWDLKIEEPGPSGLVQVPRLIWFNRPHHLTLQRHQYPNSLAGQGL